MSEVSVGDHEDPQTAPSKGSSAQNTPGVEVIEVAPGKNVAVITPPKLVVKTKRDTQEVHDVPNETAKFVDDSERRGSQGVGRVLARSLPRAD